jgi:hypothetical protein
VTRHCSALVKRMVQELFSSIGKETSIDNCALHTVSLFGFPIAVKTDDNLGEGGNVWTAVQDLAAYLDTEVKSNFNENREVTLVHSLR